MLTDSNPVECITETIENKRVTNSKAGTSNQQSENLVSGLFPNATSVANNAKGDLSFSLNNSTLC